MSDLFDALARELGDYSAETTARLLRRGRHEPARGIPISVPAALSEVIGGGGAPGGMENPMDAPGDLIVGGEDGGAEALPLGSEGQVLTVSGGTVAWANPSGIIDALMLGGM